MKAIPVLPLLAGSLALAWLATPARASHPAVTKLHGRATTNQAGHAFGSSVAISDRYVLVGEPSNDDRNPNAGAAHLYDARTGRHLRKLLAPDGGPNHSFGRAVALAGNYALVGAPSGEGNAANSGAAYLFDLRRPVAPLKLTAADGAGGDQFGTTVALSGDLALVGARRRGDLGTHSGAAYVFRVPGGEQLHKLTASDGAAGDLFGGAVSLWGDLALIGAQGDDTYRGAAYLFDARGTGQLAKLVPDGRRQGHAFGYSVALNRGMALVGEIGDDDPSTTPGAAYLFDLGTREQRAKLEPENGVIGEWFGFRVALDGNLALVGSYFGTGKIAFSGAAYLFDALSGRQLQKLSAADGEASDRFGGSVALWGGRAVVGASRDGDLGNDAGAAYLYSPLAAPLPLSEVTRIGDFAPGVPETFFSSLGDATIDREGGVTFPARLGGSGSNRGRDTGVWSDSTFFSGPRPTRLLVKSRVQPAAGGLTAAGLSVASAARPLTRSGHVGTFCEATLAGAGVGPTNRAAILAVDPYGTVNPVLRTGTSVAALGGAEIAAFREVVHGTNGGDLAVSLQLRRGAAGVSASNDSAMRQFRSNSPYSPSGASYREGEDAGLTGGVKFGEIIGRVAQGAAVGGNPVDATPVFLTGFLGPGRSSQALFSWGQLLAFQEGPAWGFALEPAVHRTFLGETISPTLPSNATFRATLKGDGVTPRNNEYLATSGLPFLARKGQGAVSLGKDVVISRFLAYWPTFHDRGVFLARLSGPGVNAGNDVALFLRQEDGTLVILLREGDPVGEPDGARVRVIQRVEVNSESGSCAVLASLTGNRARNQALFTGETLAGPASAGKSLRRLHLKLRKGDLHDQPGGGATTAIRSLSLPVTTDRAGTGGKGRNQSLDRVGRLVIQVELDNRSRRLMTGRPDPAVPPSPPPLPPP